MAKMIRIENNESEREQFVLDLDGSRVLEKFELHDFSVSGINGLKRLIGAREVYLYENRRISEVLRWENYGTEGSYSWRSLRISFSVLGGQCEVFIYSGPNESSIQKMVIYKNFEQLTVEHLFSVASCGEEVVYVGRKTYDSNGQVRWHRCLIGGGLQTVIFKIFGSKSNVRRMFQFVRLPLIHKLGPCDELLRLAMIDTLLERAEKSVTALDPSYPRTTRFH